jgi:hypothetical protein
MRESVEQHVTRCDAMLGLLLIHGRKSEFERLIRHSARMAALNRLDGPMIRLHGMMRDFKIPSRGLELMNFQERSDDGR